MKRVLIGLGVVLGYVAWGAYATQDGNALVYTGDGNTLRIEAWGEDGLRVRAYPQGALAGRDWVLDIPVTNVANISISGSSATIRNGRISATLSNTRVQSGRVQFFRHSGDKVIPILREYDYVVVANAPATRSFKSVGNGLFACEQHFEAMEGERIYGMGENDLGSLDLKGHVIDLYQRHVKAPVPFVVSSLGYGMLWNNPSLGLVEFGRDRTRWSSYGCRQIDYYITAGDTYADIFRNYTAVAGRAPVFPYWASGFWMCKLRYVRQEEYLRVAREFKQRKLPLAVHVIDYYHWPKMGDWRLDPVYWPDPKAMVDELAKMGTRVMVSPWTMVQETSENYEAMKSANLFTGSLDGNCDTLFFDGMCLHQYDPTNPKAAEFMWSKWNANYVNNGIRTFWLDPCDEFHEIADYDKVTYSIGPALECHAWFPVAHQKNVYDGLVSAGYTDVVNIARNAWAGSQRYGACPAPHDIESSYRHLKRYMKVGLNVMMSGIPWWNCDIGGFIPYEGGERFQELMARWYQYGVFLPVFRTHGCRAKNEPWTIGCNVYPAIRATLLLREKLRPYVMEQMTKAHETGLPPMRPVFFDYPDDTQAQTQEDTFLFGADILVAPVTDYGVRERSVYLPKGATWTDVWTGLTYGGGQTLTCDAPLEHIPVFVRAGRADVLSAFTGLFDREVVELENCSATGPGRIEPQDMSAYGSLWGNNKQLVWWGGLSEGQQMSITVPLQKAGIYTPKVYVSRAFDYGKFTLQLDDQTVVGPRDFYQNARDSELDVPVEVTFKSGNYQAGNHTLTITCKGKNAQSTNTLIGLDYFYWDADTTQPVVNNGTTVVVVERKK